MQNFALRRVLVFYSRIEALMQSDCKKQMETKIAAQFEKLEKNKKHVCWNLNKKWSLTYKI